ncbi:MAG: hypothetical protein ACTH7X_08615 [Brevibacterium aurantiacum]
MNEDAYEDAYDEAYDAAFANTTIGIEMAAPLVGMRRQLIESGMSDDIADEVVEGIVQNSVEQLRLQRAQVDMSIETIRAQVAGVRIKYPNKKES